MKNLLLLLIIVSFIASCGKPEIIEEGRQWNYTLTTSLSDKVDSISMEIYIDSISGNYYNEWEYTRYEDNDNPKVIFISQAEMGKTRNYNMYGIELISFVSPILEEKYQSEIFPSLHFRTPIELKEIYQNSYNLINEDSLVRTLTYGVENTGIIKYTNPVVNDYCWNLRTSCTVGDLEYDVDSYYHEKLGFVYMKYNIGDYHLTLELKKVNFDIDNEETEAQKYNSTGKLEYP